MAAVGGGGGGGAKTAECIIIETRQTKSEWLAASVRETQTTFSCVFGAPKEVGSQVLGT